MDRRILCCGALALLAGGLRAQVPTVSPLNPKPGESVRVDVTVANCGASLETAVSPPGTANGSIQLTVVQGCICLSALPPISFSENVGPLAFGTYEVKLLEEPRDNGVPCAPPQLLSTSALSVSGNGEVVALRPEPRVPVAGQPVSVGFDSFCPLVFKPARIETSGAERLIVLDQDPEAPQPAAPCSSLPAYQVRSSFFGLPSGAYRLRVRMGESSAALETVAESAFTVVPGSHALSLRQGRFRVWAQWSTFAFGSHAAPGVPLTEESGYFVFFSPDNVELVAKVLDGCSVNHHYWVFLTGLTDLDVSVYVEDTATGSLRTYGSSGRQPFRPLLDTAGFATCP